ncbi:hypothetical protein [Kitasatospora acidiphila]|nr:hypothetical protein [Kitasatospora acidiphila]
MRVPRRRQESQRRTWCSSSPARVFELWNGAGEQPRSTARPLPG